MLQRLGIFDAFHNMGSDLGLIGWFFRALSAYELIMDSSFGIEDNVRSSCRCSIFEDSHATAFGIDRGAYLSRRDFGSLYTCNTFFEQNQDIPVLYSKGYTTVVRTLRFLGRGMELSPRISFVKHPVADHLNQLKGRLTGQH